MGVSTGGLPQPELERLLGRLRQLQNLPEFAEAEQHHGLVEHSPVHLARVLLGRRGRSHPLAVHRPRVEEHVKVVRARVRNSLAVRRPLVGTPRHGVRAHGFPPPSEDVVGVRRHVVEVACPRHGGHEAVRAGLRLVGCLGRLRRMDVEVARP